jgi:hypothetical protein
MLNILMKHILYEHCIEVLFDNIQKNLNVKPKVHYSWLEDTEYTGAHGEIVAIMDAKGHIYGSMCGEDHSIPEMVLEKWDNEDPEFREELMDEYVDNILVIWDKELFGELYEFTDGE